jgi:hypothetical protein
MLMSFFVVDLMMRMIASWHEIILLPRGPPDFLPLAALLSFPRMEGLD